MKRIRRQGEFMTPLRNPSNGSFPSDLLPAIMNYWAELHLECFQTSTMELFCEYSQRPKGVIHFRKKALTQMFDWIPNAPMIGKVL